MGIEEISLKRPYSAIGEVENQHINTVKAPRFNEVNSSTASQISSILENMIAPSRKLGKRGPGERERGPRHWTAQEDQLLREAVNKHGARHWKTVAGLVPGRSHTQCLQRWNKVLKPGLRKGPWTEEEDNLLCQMMEAALPKALALAQEEGEEDPSAFVQWSMIADSIPGRSIKQCRERWCYNLDPSIRKGAWSKEEDEVLLRLQKEHGNRWAQIARLLPGRTEHTVKTRFRSILRARKREWKAEEDALLLELHRELGSKWDDIAECFPARTKNAVSTRFKYLVEQNWKNGAIKSKTTDIKAKVEPSKDEVTNSALPTTLISRLSDMGSKDLLKSNIPFSLSPTLLQSQLFSTPYLCNDLSYAINQLQMTSLLGMQPINFDTIGMNQFSMLPPALQQTYGNS